MKEYIVSIYEKTYGTTEIIMILAKDDTDYLVKLYKYTRENHIEDYEASHQLLESIKTFN